MMLVGHDDALDSRPAAITTKVKFLGKVYLICCVYYKVGTIFHLPWYTMSEQSFKTNKDSRD